MAFNHRALALLTLNLIASVQGQNYPNLQGSKANQLFNGTYQGLPMEWEFFGPGGDSLLGQIELEPIPEPLQK